MAMGNPGARILWVRETRTSLSESVLQTFEDWVLMGRVKEWFGNVNRVNRASYDYANGSKIVLGGLDQAERLYSTEWDIVVVFEAIETAADNVERFARGLSGRGIPLRRLDGSPVLWPDGSPIYRRQLIMETNPGAPGHWLNQQATVTPDFGSVDKPENRRGIDEWNRRRPMVTLDDAPDITTAAPIHRLLSRHCDNPRWFDGKDWTADGRSLLTSLATMTGHRRARLFEGLWVAAEGTVFGAEFLVSRNVVPDFPIPPEWPMWVLIDPGYDHPCAITWATVSPNGRRYTTDEIYTRQSSITEVAAMIHEKNAGRLITEYLLDPRHGFRRTQESPVTIAEQYAKEGIKCKPYPRAAGSGIDASVNAHRKALTTGMFVVFASCANAIMEHQTWSYKRTAAGDVPAGDDAYEDRNNHILDETMGWERTNPGHVPQQLGYVPGAVSMMRGTRPEDGTLEIMRERGEM